MIRDTRLVQTAVIGDEHSDVPVFLPPEAIELDAFRAAHGTDTFWCGLLLGGCGGQLGSKLYYDRQCHFQHHRLPGGGPTNCRRPAVGEASADHLYVKAALSRSLLDHGRGAHFNFPPPIGSLLDVDLGDGASLRIHMDGSTAPDWEQHRAVVLGPGVVPDRNHLASCPYVYRVRCETDGASRRVWIGTQSMAHPTEWVPIGECTWTDSGLLTPAASRILRERPAATGGRSDVPTQPVAARGLPSRSVATFIRGLEKARRNGTVEHVRVLYEGSGDYLRRLTPADRAMAESALVEAKAWLTTHEDYQQRIFQDLEAAVREQRGWDVRSSLPLAMSLTRHGASVAEQRILAAARSYLRERDHDQGGTQGLVVGGRRSGVPSAVLRSHQSASSKKASRQKDAAAQARKLIRRLRREGHLLPADEVSRLVAALLRAADASGTALTDMEHATVGVWIRKARRSQRPVRVAAAPQRSSPSAPQPPAPRPAGRPDRPEPRPRS
ncbi:hypothetical protein [Kitasatospora indigofera]|uniref:hypothetical protein n=1 Tax=Kitasatospora indigofera TaxID=67307 RepID=UPI0033A78683